ncbi:NitT/TauT family transport system substrate-binding protein [Prauserella marina]|uniref:NitT/TauT family transport system substrate-binding protein n=1 Tax=Prauserella marina TaxID=530584 RepID=A0A1G6W2H0_9PSEU|nr:ABC transporter substrate-binding protein [Prauserella marina]PWV73975.1 NitT/TauT family transport system substrate-binding protein [Prauserella marina]SDD60140.1 NitT/TauT family transport system substrate-binding protein [Prauserella marina]
MPTFSRTRRRRWRTTGAMAAAIAVGVTTACSPGEPDPADAGACGGQTVRIGFLKSSPSDAPFILADELGYFAEEGIKPDFYTFDSAAKMVAPLGAGHLDVGGGAPSAGLYNAVARGVAIRIVADKATLEPGYGYMPLLVRKDLVDSGAVSGPADLAGRTVAEPAQGTATSSTLQAIMDSAGKRYDDVKHTYMRMSEHATALGNGAIDASMTTEPTATLAEERGVAVRMVDPSGQYPGQQLATVLYSEDFAQDNPELGDCFMRSFLKAVRTYMAAVPGGDWTGPRAEELSEIIGENVGMAPALLRRTVPTHMDPNGQVNAESLNRDYRFFAGQRFLENEVSIDALIDRTFARKAASELGVVGDTGS